jgi:CBS domain-containing protein
MKVRELYTPHLLRADPGEDLAVAASRMEFHEIGALAVYERGRLAGIITERDILRAVGDGRNPELTPVAAYMVEDPVTVSPDTEASEAAATMVSLGVRHLPVVEGGGLVGMLSARDLLVDEAAKALVG